MRRSLGAQVKEIMKRLSLLIALSASMIGCRTTVISHDEHLAAKAAQRFSEVTFIQNNIPSSYSMLSESAKRLFTAEKLQQINSQMHPAARPVTVKATEFEPIPGQRAMNIFISGENGQEKFYYRITMEGTAQTGYAPSGFYRGNGPYPVSALRQKMS